MERVEYPLDKIFVQWNRYWP